MSDDRWSAAKPLRVGFVTLAILVFGFGGWAMLTHIAGAVIAHGQVEVENNRQVVQHPDGGVVAEILVVEAQSVKQGDVLIRLDGSLAHSELAIVEGQLYEAMARRARLEAERDEAEAPVFPAELQQAAAQRPEVMELLEGQRKLFFSRLDTLDKQTQQLQKRAAQIAAQTTGIDAQITALNTQIDLINQEMTDQKTLLAKGLAQNSRVLALEREAAQLLGSVGELTSSRAQNEGRGTEIELELLRLAALRREEASTQLRDIGQTELELIERRAALRERIARLEIRAPVSGLVLGLQVTSPQSVLRPADPVLYIVPQDRPLVITARISPIHVDEVHVGQDVRLVFPAFSTRTTPEIHGHLISISADAIVDQQTGMTYYRAQIVLDEGEQEKLSHETLLPGMPVDAFIATGARTPMAYLLQPFTDYFRAAFRES
jgi:HlyD family secretion protein